MARYIRASLLVTLLLGAAALAAAQDIAAAAAASSAKWRDKGRDKDLTPWDIIKNSRVHTLLTAALKANKLVGAVNKKGITVFAPTDDQVGELLTKIPNTTPLDAAVVAAVLAHHVVTRPKLRSGSLRTLNGNIFNKGTRERPDLYDGKGVSFSVTPIKLTARWSLYQPDRVLLPANAFFSLADAVTALKGFDTLTGLVSDNNLGDKTILEALEDPEPQKTVFGPTDQAFTNIAKILETLDTDTVVKVLTYHVSPKVYTVKFANTANVPTLLGQKLALRRPKFIIDTTRDPASVIPRATNIYFPGGVFQGIHKVLIPKLSD